MINEQRPPISAAREALAAITYLRTPLTEWVVYLAEPAFDREPELRSKIFCLLVSVLLEAGAEADNRIGRLRRAVEQEDTLPGQKLVDILDFALEAIGDLMAIFTTEEVVAMQVRRHAMVHGKLSFKRNDEKVWQIQNGRIVRSIYPLERYYNGSIEVYRTHGGPGSFLTSMRDRFSHYQTLLWTIGQMFNMTAFVEFAAREVEENRTDLLRVEWGTSSYREAKLIYADRPDLFRSLASYRDDWRSNSTSLDPVFLRYYPEGAV